MVALAIWPVTLAAQNIDSPYRFLDTRQSVSVFGGHVSTGRGTVGLGPESGMMFGARYSIGVSGPFVLEASLSWFSATRAVQDTVPGDSGRVDIGDVDFSALSLLADIRFNLTGPRTWHGLLPYLLIGGGLTTDAASEDNLNSALPADVKFDFGTTFTGVLGGGIEWVPSSRFGFRVDARNLLWKLTTPAVFLRGLEAGTLPSDQWAQNFALTAGVVLRF